MATIDPESTQGATTSALEGPADDAECVPHGPHKPIEIVGEGRPALVQALFHGLLGLMEASGGHPVPVGGGVGSQAVERVVGIVVRTPVGPPRRRRPGPAPGPHEGLVPCEDPAGAGGASRTRLPWPRGR